MNDHWEWEALRFVTLDGAVTQTKLTGSCFEFHGKTTPEGWPFAVLVVVAKPGNEKAMEYLQEFRDKMAAAGPVVRVDKT
jgi:hypothetical protein